MVAFNNKNRLFRLIMQITLLICLMLTLSDVWAIPHSVGGGTEEDDICGVWYTKNNNSKVEIYRKNGMYFGKIIWLKTPAKVNFTNKTVISDMTYNQARGVWDKGTLYYPVKDAQYQGIIELSNKDTLSIRAFVGTPALGKTLVWVRAK